MRSKLRTNMQPEHIQSLGLEDWAKEQAQQGDIVEEYDYSKDHKAQHTAQAESFKEKLDNIMKPSSEAVWSADDKESTDDI